MNWPNNVVDNDGEVTHYNPNNSGWFTTEGQ